MYGVDGRDRLRRRSLLAGFDAAGDDRVRDDPDQEHERVGGPDGTSWNRVATDGSPPDATPTPLGRGPSVQAESV
jgi:hypothetical protein